jgi:hypothetical protein
MHASGSMRPCARVVHGRPVPGPPHRLPLPVRRTTPWLRNRGFSVRPEIDAAETEHRARVDALARHNPPRDIWLDEAGEMRFGCITDEPNPDCVGCREFGRRPTGQYWRFTPPVSAPGGTL